MFDRRALPSFEGFTTERLASSNEHGYVPKSQGDRSLLTSMCNSRVGGRITLPSGAILPPAREVLGHAEYWVVVDGRVIVPRRE
jgi:hypothetical protein